MGRLLIVEDEAVLRTSLARGIARLAGVEVADAGSVDEALVKIDARAPDLIISDIDMPERTGIELLGEVAKRGLKIPVIFVTAYLKAYGAQIPRHANIEVMEKPVALEDIRRMVLAKLKQSEVARDTNPFTAVDFLQLAGMGRRSVLIESTWPNGAKGTITVQGGQVWDARVGRFAGEEAFTKIAWAQGCRVRCMSLTEPPGTRTLHDSVEGLLMRSAQAMDENARDGIGSADDFLEEAVRLSSRPPPAQNTVDEASRLEEPRPVVDEAFERHLDAGVAALLSKDYAAAWAEFVAADAVTPGNATVAANLARLRELGFGPEGGD
ncbi:MAG: response regulator [Myxococcales bacterium]|nr:response regulator [Myxococcales bacterium]